MPSRVVNEDTDFYFSESSHLKFFTARYNSLLKRNFLMVILVHMYLA